MQKVIRKFKSFEEADEAERRDYAALSIQQRIDITMELVSWMDATAWRSLGAILAILKQAGSPFLVIGGYAYGAHGICRYTPDLDIWLEQDSAQIGSILGQVELVVCENEGVLSGFSSSSNVIGKEPARFHIHTEVTGLAFETALKNSELALLYGESIRVLSRADLVSNKRALRRLVDLADLEALGEK